MHCTPDRRSTCMRSESKPNSAHKNRSRTGKRRLTVHIKPFAEFIKSHSRSVDGPCAQYEDVHRRENGCGPIDRIGLSIGDDRMVFTRIRNSGRTPKARRRSRCYNASHEFCFRAGRNSPLAVTGAARSAPGSPRPRSGLRSNRADSVRIRDQRSQSGWKRQSSHDITLRHGPEPFSCE